MSATWKLPAHLPAADAAAALVRHLATGVDQSVSPGTHEGRPQVPAQVLAIDGLTGSGKSTLAHRIGALLQPQLPTEILHLDEVVPGWDHLSRGVTRAQVLLTRLAHELDTRPDQPASTTVPTWDWDTMTPGQPRRVHLSPGGVLILEGSGALAALPARLPPLRTTRVLVIAPQADRRRRIRERDSYPWDVTAWETQERQVSATWRDAPGRTPDVVVEHPSAAEHN